MSQRPHLMCRLRTCFTLHSPLSEFCSSSLCLHPYLFHVWCIRLLKPRIATPRLPPIRRSSYLLMLEMLYPLVAPPSTVHSAILVRICRLRLQHLAGPRQHPRLFKLFKIRWAVVFFDFRRYSETVFQACVKTRNNIRTRLA
jgi:hypothetical protein